MEVFIARGLDAPQSVGRGLYGDVVKHTRKSDTQNTVMNAISPREVDRNLTSTCILEACEDERTTWEAN